MTNVQTMHIGELAERTDLSLRTLRHYDEIGLLEPSARSEGGFRLYTEDDFDRLMLIRRMKPLGYSLEQMRDLLSALDASRTDSPVGAQAHHILAEFLADARQRRDKLEREIAAADEFIGLLDRQITP